MRITIAGAGGLARYFSEEFRKHGHSVVILTRSEKEYFRNRPHITQVITDYCVASIVAALGGCEILISVILSPKYKRFISSEFFGDIENYPDLPPLYSEVREPIRKTLVCNGWLVSYIVPKGNLHLMDIGEGFPIDTIRNRIVIPGNGKDAVNRYPAMREVKCNSTDQEELLLAHYQIFVPLGAVSFDPDKVEAHRRKFFAGLQFRSPGQLIDEVEEDPDKVV
ncbi:hypothetical protein BDV39DRAFT_211988 [Aspergillus sergii]|uniref:NmrA-like domain-containing protein n=1 Tax=Aspergillus sergii TaxID=1034303 RepID=A0A5N6XNL0_9EURO|nr:hypothetical protein BDV39DRAFT_211988 [Aspergillus sergii]